MDVVHRPVRELVFDPPEIVQTRAASGGLGGPDGGCERSGLGGDANVDGAACACVGLEVVVPQRAGSREEGAGFAGIY